MELRSAAGFLFDSVEPGAKCDDEPGAKCDDERGTDENVFLPVEVPVDADTPVGGETGLVFSTIFVVEILPPSA